MKSYLQSFALCFVLLSIGFMMGTSGHLRAAPVHAQLSTPSYGCNIGNGGSNYSAYCTQYIVEVSTQRGVSGFSIYQMQSDPYDVEANAATAPMVGSGSLTSGAAVQVFLPDSSTQTFTLSASQP